MKTNLLALVILFFILNSCGYKISNQQNNFKINNILTEGDKKLNYKIKNKLLSSNSNKDDNLISIKVFTKKEKNIKEKNISNEITKYELIITSQINYKSISNNTNENFTITKKGDYNVSTKHSDTLNKEKNLIKTLIDDIAQEILETLISNLNDT